MIRCFWSKLIGFIDANCGDDIREVRLNLDLDDAHPTPNINLLLDAGAAMGYNFEWCAEEDRWGFGLEDNEECRRLRMLISFIDANYRNFEWPEQLDLDSPRATENINLLLAVRSLSPLHQPARSPASHPRSRPHVIKNRLLA